MAEEARSWNFDVIVLSSGRLRQLNKYIRTIKTLIHIFRREKVEIVLNWMGKAHLYGGIAAFVANVPSIWYQLGWPEGWAWMDRIITLIPSVAVFTCSKATAQLQRRLWPHRRVDVVYPSAALEKFNPETLPPPVEARRQLGLPESGPLIGMVGRLQRWKGMHTLVQAMPRILERHPDARAVIVGGRHELEPDYEPWLRGLIVRLGLQDRVRLAGFQTDIPLWMQAMDVVVHASDREPFGIVVVEAMALGKPVVAGAEGGPREIITEGVDGLLAPYEDAETLARQILRYLDDPAFARRVGEAARHRARDFSPEAFAQRVLDVLQSFEEMPDRIAPEAHEKRRDG